MRQLNPRLLKEKSLAKISCGPKKRGKKKGLRRLKPSASRRPSIQQILAANSAHSFVGGRKKSIEEIKKNVRRKSMQRRARQEKARKHIEKSWRKRQVPKVEEVSEDFPAMHDDADMEGFPGLDEDETEDFPEPSAGRVSRGRPPSIPELPNRLLLHSKTDTSSVPPVSIRRASTIISSVELKSAAPQPPTNPKPSKQLGHTNFSKLLANVCDAMKEIRVQHSGFLSNLRRFVELYVDGSLEAEDFVVTVAREMPAPTAATEAIKQIIRDNRLAGKSSYNTVKNHVVAKFGQAEFAHHERLIQTLLRNSSALKLPPPPPPRHRRRTNSGSLAPTRSLSTPAFTAVAAVPQHHRSATAEAALSDTGDMAETSSPKQPNLGTTTSGPQFTALVPPSRFGAQSDSETSQTWETFCNTPAIATLFSNFKAVAISNQNFSGTLDSGLLPGQADLVALGSQCSAHGDLDYNDISEALVAVVSGIHRALSSAPELFRIYAQYSTGYGPSMEEFQGTLNGPATEALRAALERFREEHDSSNLTLMDYLIMPVQQMFKHRLLLKKLTSTCAKLCAGVSGEEDQSAGVRAVGRAVEIEITPLVAQCAEVLDLACKHIDSLVNKAEEYQALRLIQKQFLDNLMLTRRGRRVVHKGQVQMHRLTDTTGQPGLLSRQKSFYKALSQHSKTDSSFSLLRRGSRRNTVTRRPAGGVSRDRRNTTYDGERSKAKLAFSPVYVHLFNDLLVISESKSNKTGKIARSTTVIHSDAHAYERSFLQQQQRQLQQKKRQGKVRTLLLAINIEDCTVQKEFDGDELEFCISASDKRTMIFQASSPEERNEWVQALQRIVSEVVQVSASMPVSALPSAHTGVWIDDSKAQACALCAKRFSTFTRKHHCRNCGLVVCTKCSQARRVLKSNGPVGVRVCDSCDDWRERYFHPGAGDTSPGAGVTPSLAGSFYGHRYIRWPALSPTATDVKEGMVCLSGRQHASSALAFVLGVSSFDLTLSIPNLRAPFWTLFLGNELVGQGFFECKGDAAKQGSIWRAKNVSILAQAKVKNKDKMEAVNVAFICHVPIPSLPTTSLSLRVFHQPPQFGKLDTETFLGSAEIPLLHLVSHFELCETRSPSPSQRKKERFGSPLDPGNASARLAGYHWRRNKRFHPADIVRSCSAVALPVFCSDKDGKFSPHKVGSSAATAMRTPDLGKRNKEPSPQIGTVHLCFDVGTPESLREGDGKDIIRTLEQFCDVLSPEMRKSVMAPKLMRQGLNQYFHVCYAEAQSEVAELQNALDNIDASQFEAGGLKGYSSSMRNLLLNSDDLSADLHRCSERFNRLMWMCDGEKDANSLLSINALECLGEDGTEDLFACQVHPSPLLSARTTSVLLPPEWKEMFQKEILFLRNMLALDVVWGRVIRAIRDNADLSELQENETDISKRLQLQLHSDQARAILHENSGVHIALESAHHIYTVHRAMVCALYRAFGAALQPPSEATPLDEENAGTPPSDGHITKLKSHRRQRSNAVLMRTESASGSEAADRARASAQSIVDADEPAPSEDQKWEYFDNVTMACVPILVRCMSLFQVYSSFVSHCMDVCVCFSLPTFAAYRNICVQKHASFVGSASPKNRRHFGTSMIWLQPVTHLQWFEKFLLALKDKLEQRHKQAISSNLSATCAGEAFLCPTTATSMRERTLEQLKHMHMYVRQLRARLRNILAESDRKNAKV